MTADENATRFDILPSGEQVEAYLSLSKVPQAVVYVHVSVRGDTDALAVAASSSGLMTNLAIIVMF